jgi:hypothetical protein
VIDLRVQMSLLSASAMKRSASVKANANLHEAYVKTGKCLTLGEADKEFFKQLTSVFCVVETYQVVPWDDEDIWAQLLEAATQGSDAFVDGLEWYASSAGGLMKPRDRGKEFVFHKSMTKEQRHSIHRISGKLFVTATERTPTGDNILHVYVPKWLDM